MSLRKCAECGGKVSTLAPICPHCGYSPLHSCIQCKFFWEINNKGSPSCISDRNTCPAFVLNNESDKDNFIDTDIDIT